MELLVPEKNPNTFKYKNIFKFTIFVSMFSDGYQILLQTLSKFEQINYLLFPLKSLENLGFLNFQLLISV